MILKDRQAVSTSVRQCTIARLRMFRHTGYDILSLKLQASKSAVEAGAQQQGRHCSCIHSHAGGRIHSNITTIRGAPRSRLHATCVCMDGSAAVDRLDALCICALEQQRDSRLLSSPGHTTHRRCTLPSARLSGPRLITSHSTSNPSIHPSAFVSASQPWPTLSSA